MGPNIKDPGISIAYDVPAMEVAACEGPQPHEVSVLEPDAQNSELAHLAGAVLPSHQTGYVFTDLAKRVIRCACEAAENPASAQGRAEFLDAVSNYKHAIDAELIPLLENRVALQTALLTNHVHLTRQIAAAQLGNRILFGALSKRVSALEKKVAANRAAMNDGPKELDSEISQYDHFDIVRATLEGYAQGVARTDADQDGCVDKRRARYLELDIGKRGFEINLAVTDGTHRAKLRFSAPKAHWPLTTCSILEFQGGSTQEAVQQAVPIAESYWLRFQNNFGAGYIEFDGGLVTGHPPGENGFLSSVAALAYPDQYSHFDLDRQHLLEPKDSSSTQSERAKLEEHKWLGSLHFSLFFFPSALPNGKDRVVLSMHPDSGAAIQIEPLIY